MAVENRADPTAKRRPDLVALACLLGAGALLGLSTNLAKIASALELSPATYLCGSSAGAAILLFLVAARGGGPSAPLATIGRYAVIAGLLSFAAPNLLAFSAVPQIGVGFVALAIAFPPLLTWLGAVALRLEVFERIRGLAVIVAMAGALWLARAKLAAPEGDLLWIVAALFVPLLLAAGNIYRTIAWPQGERPDVLAAAMLLASAAMVAAAIGTGLVPGAWPTRGYQLVLIGVQAIAFALQYLLFFILQRRGGPVLLSLMGSVAALVGIPVAVLMLGEQPPPGILIGGGLIAAGVALMAYRNSRAPARAG